MDALRKSQDGFGIKTAIMVGTPLTMMDNFIQSPSLERVINIFGSDDIFYDLQEGPSIPDFFTGTHSIETINIKLLDVNHNEYFYANGATPTLEQVKASNFIAWLTQASLSDATLTRFLELIGTPTIQPYTDPITGIEHTIRTYVIDTRNLPDNF